MTKDLDITQPRECIYREFKGRPGPCPHCGGPLRTSYQTYMVITRRGSKTTDSFMMGSDTLGWFCENCPTVVINPVEINDKMQYQLPHWDVGDEFVVVGLVDLDAVPPERHHLPLGEEGNPIPLIKFTNISDAQPSEQFSSKRHRRAKGRFR